MIDLILTEEELLSKHGIKVSNGCRDIIHIPLYLEPCLPSPDRNISVANLCYLKKELREYVNNTLTTKYVFVLDCDAEEFALNTYIDLLNNNRP